MKGKLYVVPTPIGNLEDITLRAIRILSEVDLILAEDTRVSRKLLSHYKIDTALESHHQNNEHATVSKQIEKMKQGLSLALISDAGTPAISDPGFLLVRETVKAGIEVDCLPGPTALIVALVNSGIPTERFVFEGFLPPKKGRQKKLQQISDEERTIVFYESPHKLNKTLAQLAELIEEDRTIAVCREMTKKFEETIRGRLKEVQQHFEENSPKGEFVIVLSGKK
ncbi:MAG: 16S rRNA (cytidine(1402)-2'-O)-methyltransferase [Flavobacteriaceae bacterium]|jgi:16S rRNA (cytidine1402-2'-O)-methyltransferase|nr:16S rRNA (cytidine(1402)-2'-O)-methyltransferase [Flavobacteriaceae bacterium]